MKRWIIWILLPCMLLALAACQPATIESKNFQLQYVGADWGMLAHVALTEPDYYFYENGEAEAPISVITYDMNGEEMELTWDDQPGACWSPYTNSVVYQYMNSRKNITAYINQDGQLLGYEDAGYGEKASFSQDNRIKKDAAVLMAREMLSAAGITDIATFRVADCQLQADCWHVRFERYIAGYATTDIITANVYLDGTPKGYLIIQHSLFPQANQMPDFDQEAIQKAAYRQADALMATQKDRLAFDTVTYTAHTFTAVWLKEEKMALLCRIETVLTKDGHERKGPSLTYLATKV
ncbi:MAG: hypothetical protein J6D31_06340 [Clostridia bacterium]|nr:hypothetical protein [Clostridia bacterium]